MFGIEIQSFYEHSVMTLIFLIDLYFFEVSINFIEPVKRKHNEYYENSDSQAGAEHVLRGTEKLRWSSTLTIENTPNSKNVSQANVKEGF